MSTKFLYPRLDNYYSDWHQLTFTFEKDAKYAGIYVYSEDAHGRVSSQIFALNLSKIPKEVTSFNQDWKWNYFINTFNRIWLHEWLHLVGLTERGINLAKELGFPVA